jgi:hypothetical protein
MLVNNDINEWLNDQDTVRQKKGLAIYNLKIAICSESFS